MKNRFWMPLIFGKFLLLSLPAYSQEEPQEECIFDENAYTDFIKAYAASHAYSEILPDGKSLLVLHANEEILVEGGGCTHLGLSIHVKSSQPYDENQFLQKVLGLSTEFGEWLLNIPELNEAILEMNWNQIDGIYHFNLNEMTVFEADNDQGNINISFYIN